MHAVKCDIGSLWMNQIEPCWKRGLAVVAGLSDRDSLFFFELFARDCGVGGTTAVMLAAGVTVFKEATMRERKPKRWHPSSFWWNTAPMSIRENANGETALHGAAYHGKDDFVQYLADHGAKLASPTASDGPR